jgi:hypothetical protein
MQIDPEELQQLLNQTFAEWYEDANTAPVANSFSLRSLDQAGKHFCTSPSWDLSL